MAELDANLLAAAGFVGAGAEQNATTARAKNQIDQSQIGLAGDQKRQSINDQAESSGMYNSSNRNRDITAQGADQANRSALSDLGMNDTIAQGNISMMQEVARQQLEQQQQAQQRSLFDQNLSFEREKLANQAGPAVDYDLLAQMLSTKQDPWANTNQADVRSKLNARGW